jgi:hypothetical protein
VHVPSRAHPQQETHELLVDLGNEADREGWNAGGSVLWQDKLRIEDNMKRLINVTRGLAEPRTWAGTTVPPVLRNGAFVMHT